MRMSPARVWREKGARYRLEGGRCKRCGKAFYPPKPACPYCGYPEVEKVELPKRGRVISFAIEHIVPEGFRHQAPVIVALIELENGVKVLSTLTDVRPENVYIGMPVEATLRRIWEEEDEGIIIYGIKFAPAEQQ
jgi:uncharacterized OB-fold protein